MKIKTKSVIKGKKVIVVQEGGLGDAVEAYLHSGWRKPLTDKISSKGKCPGCAKRKELLNKLTKKNLDKTAQEQNVI